MQDEAGAGSCPRQVTAGATPDSSSNHVTWPEGCLPSELTAAGYQVCGRCLLLSASVSSPRGPGHKATLPADRSPRGLEVLRAAGHCRSRSRAPAGHSSDVLGSSSEGRRAGGGRRPPWPDSSHQLCPSHAPSSAFRECPRLRWLLDQLPHLRLEPLPGLPKAPLCSPMKS